MDNRLVFAVLFVTLSWMSVGTYAQNTTTEMPGNTTTSNMTTSMSTSNMTTSMSTSNMTTSMSTSNMTTPMSGNNGTTPMSGNNMTTPMSGNNGTTPMSGNNGTTPMSGNNMTTPMSGSNMTTPMLGSNMTTPMSGNNMTTPMSGSNMTAPMSGSNMTTPMSGSNMTTPMLGGNATTGPPPLVTNTTVETLTANISRAGCGSEQLCAAEPSSCDPSSGTSCFFLGARSRGGRNFDFELAGESDGYLAATVSTDANVGNGDDTYVCANNNGVVKFFARVFENGKLIEKTLNVNSVRGKVNGRRIQCSFSATVPQPRTKSTNLALSISTGPFNSSDGTLGAPNVQLRSPVVNLANPSTNVTNEVSNTTTAAPATTTPAPLVTNTTVETLTANITRDGCGSQQLCAAEPSSCDPSSGTSCFFLSAKSRGGRNFDFELAGQSDGYLAATVSTDSEVGNGDDTYVCANNNGVVKFFARVFENGELKNKTLNVNSVRGKVNGGRIQCTFSATVPEPLTRTTNLAVSISNGTFNSSDDTLGAPNVQFRSAVVNLANPSTNVTNELSTTTTAPATTTAPPTTAHAITLQQSLTQVLLVLAGVLSLAML